MTDPRETGEDRTADGGGTPEPPHPPAADTELTDERLLPAKRSAPTRGWQEVVYRLTRGLVNLGPGPAERHDIELIGRLDTPVPTPHHIAVLSLKGGPGKTTATALLGHTLATHRPDRVVALDASPDAGTLGFRVVRETHNSVQDLLADADAVGDYRDVRAYTSRSTSGLEVLAARTEPDLSAPLGAEGYRAVAALLARYYSLIITDCSPGLLHPTMEPVLNLANQLLIVVSPTVDGGRSGSLLLDWMTAHGRGDLVRDAVVVLNCLQERSLVEVSRFEGHFGERCRQVVRIPYDPHLGYGAETELTSLRPATRTAYLELAAAVVDPGRRD